MPTRDQEDAMVRSTELSTSLAHTGLLPSIPVTASSTTSRVLVNNPALRVVVFAFDEGEMLTDHSSPRAVVVQLLDGAIRFTVGDDEHAMAPGDVIYLAPGERHALVADVPSHLSLVMVDVEATAARG
jgi:quercetin dioxygenase-like cupin family protein